MVRQQYPMLEDHISTTISPMCAVSRLIKSRDPQVKTVFVGPCVAKKSEVADQKIPGNADYVMTYGEIRAHHSTPIDIFRAQLSLIEQEILGFICQFLTI